MIETWFFNRRALIRGFLRIFKKKNLVLHTTPKAVRAQQLTFTNHSAVLKNEGQNARSQTELAQGHNADGFTREHADLTTSARKKLHYMIPHSDFSHVWI